MKSFEVLLSQECGVVISPIACIKLIASNQSRHKVACDYAVPTDRVTKT